jgi:hypothetical protein
MHLYVIAISRGGIRPTMVPTARRGRLMQVRREADFSIRADIESVKTGSSVERYAHAGRPPKANPDHSRDRGRASLAVVMHGMLYLIRDMRLCGTTADFAVFDARVRYRAAAVRRHS